MPSLEDRIVKLKESLATADSINGQLIFLLEHIIKAWEEKPITEPIGQSLHEKLTTAKEVIDGKISLTSALTRNQKDQRQELNLEEKTNE